MPDPVTIGAAVGWGISAVGWVVSPIISKLLNKGFYYLGLDGSEKLKELETKVLQLELTLEAVEESPHRDRLEKWLKELRSAFYEAEDILDDVEYYRLERQIVSQPDDKLESDAMPPRRRNWVMKKLQAALPQCSRLKKQASGTTSDDAPPDMSKMELKKILEKIENIINEAHKILQLLNMPSHSNVDKRQTVAAVTTAAPPPVVIGRDKDRDKIIAMLWKGRKEVNGGCCLVAWEKVQRPIDLGGLGISNLQTMGWALQMRCLWLEKTSTNRPWAGLDFPVQPQVRAMFAISVLTLVGNGINTLFWSDRWLHGCSLLELAPVVVNNVSRRSLQNRTVAQALQNHNWVRDIQGSLSMEGLVQYLHLWDSLEEFSLTQEEDHHNWKHERSGLFSSKSTYRAFLHGAISFEPWQRLWKTWAPPKCKMFLWLAIKNKCWTADRLVQRGLSHPEHCVLCDQEEETVQHILTSCVFARQFWHNLLSPLGYQCVVPRRNEKSFAEWWRKASKKVTKTKKKGFNSAVILGAWMLWNHRNRIVFDRASPSVSTAQQFFMEELRLWSFAGAIKLQELFFGRHVDLV